MRWTFIICVLVSSTIIASPVTKGSKHKRSLSFLTSLLLSNLGDLGHTPEKCTRAPRRKTSKENTVSPLPNRQKEVALPERNLDGKRRNQTRSKPKRVRNNNGTSLANFANDPYQAISQTLGISNTTRPKEYINTTRPTNVKTSTQKSTDDRPKIQNLSDNRIIANNEPRAMSTDNFNIEQTIYVTPNTYTMPSELQYVNPMIGIPRNYFYEQEKVDTVQTFALDDNLNVIVTETNKLPRPAYLDDRIKDIILSVPPYGQEMYPSGVNTQYDGRIKHDHIISSVAPYVNQFYPSTVIQQYQEVGMYPNNMLFNQQHGNFDSKLASNYLSKYTGDPIIVTDKASEVMKTSMPLQDTELNKTIEGNLKEKPRGDIPD